MTILNVTLVTTKIQPQDHKTITTVIISELSNLLGRSCRSTDLALPEGVRVHAAGDTRKSNGSLIICTH